MANPSFSRTSSESETPALELPYLAPGFVRNTANAHPGKSLQNFLAHRHPEKVSDQEILSTPFIERKTAVKPLQRLNKKSHAPYYNLAFRKSRPLKMNDLGNPFKLLHRSLNTFLNLIIHIFARNQAEFNREVMRHLNGK